MRLLVLVSFARVFQVETSVPAQDCGRALALLDLLLSLLVHGQWSDPVSRARQFGSVSGCVLLVDWRVGIGLFGTRFVICVVGILLRVRRKRRRSYVGMQPSSVGGVVYRTLYLNLNCGAARL